jgi:hypothetical protein
MHPDAAFLDAFERCTLPAFKHRDHLRMTWLYLRRDGRPRADVRIIEGLRRFARHQRAERIFDRALTEAWIARVAAALERNPEVTDFPQFLQQAPELLQRAP